MGIKRSVTKIGGSLGIIIPRDLCESMDIREGSGVSISMVGRQMVVEPDDDTVPEPTFRRAFAAVLRRYGPAFKALADFDRGTSAMPSGRLR
jgi:antitoxin component of MazEF toxin-antitoxin module